MRDADHRRTGLKPVPPATRVWLTPAAAAALGRAEPGGFEPRPRPIGVDRIPCRHRGQVVEFRQRRRGCGHCSDAVYTCALHGLAAVHSCGRDVAICLGCPDGDGPIQD
jgi:hypothetical protein